MIRLKGLGTALVTPFKENGDIDYETYRSLVRRQTDSGADFLVALATTGETPALNAEEKRRLLAITHEEAVRKDGIRIPILAGCGSNSVPGTLANMDALDGDLVDAWLVVVPFYNKPTQEGQYLYFKAIAAATGKPIVIYNVPGRTGANMTAQTCLRLAREVKNIIATKEASGKLEQAVEIVKGSPEGFSVLSGDDDLTIAMMKEGAAGVISVAANVCPADMVRMTDSAAGGDWEQALAIENRLKPLFKACFVESNPIPVKEALHQMGLCTSQMRLPLVKASRETSEIIKNTLADL